MDIVEEKGIEKLEDDIEIVEKVKEKKPRKPRSEAQKAAFEKARKKRAENIAKKKSQPQNEVSPELEENQTQLGDNEKLPDPPPTPKKKRGRPKGSKKLKREPEPPRGTYLPPNIPPEAGDIRYAYQQPPQGHHSQFNPWMAYQPQPPPQVHNYYYGHQQGAVSQAPEPAPAPAPEPVRPITPDYEDSSEESVDYLDAPQYQEPLAPDPRLKFRFG